MRIHVRTSARRGAILPYVAVSLLALCGFIALAIDLGMVMVAKTQTQNAADAAAFAAARTLTGGANANTTQATANGQAAGAANRVLGTSITAANVTMTHGAYHYDPSSQTFYPQFPPVCARQLQSVPGHDYAGKVADLRQNVRDHVVQCHGQFHRGQSAARCDHCPRLFRLDE